MTALSARARTVVTEGEDALHAPPGFLGWVAELVHSHRERLLAYARRRGRSAEEALDAVQDCFVSFLRLSEARSIAREGDDALKLLTVLLRHNLMNQWRKGARHGRAQEALAATTPDAEHETSETMIARAEELGRIHGCILRMATLQRRVVMLSLLDEQPRDHVAQALGISDGYVRVLLHRAREHLRHCTYAEAEELLRPTS